MFNDIMFNHYWIVKIVSYGIIISILLLVTLFVYHTIDKWVYKKIDGLGVAINLIIALSIVLASPKIRKELYTSEENINKEYKVKIIGTHKLVLYKDNQQSTLKEIQCERPYNECIEEIKRDISKTIKAKQRARSLKKD